jgi:diacylglycerol kinase family enzyme
LRKLSTLSTFGAIGRMLSAANDQDLRGRNVLSRHDQARVLMRASRPIAFQIDGEYMGERQSVVFHSVPKALRVVASAP